LTFLGWEAFQTGWNSVADFLGGVPLAFFYLAWTSLAHLSPHSVLVAVALHHHLQGHRDFQRAPVLEELTLEQSRIH
jgi:hypothetical protein